MRLLARLMRRPESIAPRDDPPAQLAAADRALIASEKFHSVVKRREPAVLAVAREIRTIREDNHIAQRLERLWQEGKQA